MVKYWPVLINIHLKILTIYNSISPSILKHKCCTIINKKYSIKNKRFSPLILYPKVDLIRLNWLEESILIWLKLPIIIFLYTPNSLLISLLIVL